MLWGPAPLAWWAAPGGKTLRSRPGRGRTEGGGGREEVINGLGSARMSRAWSLAKSLSSIEAKRVVSGPTNRCTRNNAGRGVGKNKAEVSPRS